MLAFKGLEVRWLGHAGFSVRGGGREIVFDPYQLKTRAKLEADIVFITHEHFDHLSASDLAKVTSPQKTTIVAARNCMDGLAKVSCKSKVFVTPGDKGEVEGVRYWAVPAFNVNKFRSPGVVFHPREYGGVGFVVEVAGVRIYHPGDTDVIPEMRQLGRIDLAFLPVSGVYVMTAAEAVEAANIIAPEVAVPMHYGAIAGSRRDAEEFKSKAKCRVEILEPEA
ncbi:MAG: MBL fold metallo-hydrolase [Nitrososphaerota archaeon]|nr:MBL fold metallo-hydrolase [Candidatus Calditenuaceae archaeon]MDW8073341.1 MBL fold metallo-hydrolase [Nitrososphaerota archaeon]